MLACPPSTLRSIDAIAADLRLPEQYLEPYGRHTGKVRLDLLSDPRFPVRGKLILVTAATPTTGGEGKTVTAIGLAQGLERIGRRAAVTSREPSLGPVFGLKGGAAGGGCARIEPAAKIDLHFHGDFHAITAAHNLLAALIDAHLHHGNDLDLDPDQITWPRAMDMNDRSLRRIRIGMGAASNGPERSSGFVITAASEIMAILALANGREDLRHRLGSILIGWKRRGEPVFARDLQATGPMMVLLNDALLPNLAQTTEGGAAFVHAGPFANIAHGTSSVLSQQMALRLTDFAINETGFGSDLGAEKYFDIVMRQSGIAPAAAVLVVTVPGLKAQGCGDLAAGFANLERHIANLRAFSVPTVAAINRRPTDQQEELDEIGRFCASQGIDSAVSDAYARGGIGAEDLAWKVVEASRQESQPRSTYPLDWPLKQKIEAVATKVYGADGLDFLPAAEEKLARFEKFGFGGLPVCMAKTQYSLSDNPKLLGAPAGWRLKVSDAALSAGAGFVVVISGSMMLMPGLPKDPRAVSMDVDAEGKIVGV